jgi:hypothetical protein
VFNGSRFRAEIVPRISDFVLSNNANSARTGGTRPTRTKPTVVATNNGAPAHPLPVIKVRAANE